MFIYEVLIYEIPSTCAVCKDVAGGRTREGKLCDSHSIVSSVLCAAHHHGKTCNRHASPLCPFHTMPLQSVQWTCMQKLQEIAVTVEGDILFLATIKLVTRK